MITKLWSLLMLKLTRLIVAIENAFKKHEKPSEKTGTNELIKKLCKSHDYCEECPLYDAGGCLFKDDPEGIPCYWEVDE